MTASNLRDGLWRGGRRAVLHLMKAGVEVLKGLEAFFEELSAATRDATEDVPGRDEGPERITLE